METYIFKDGYRPILHSLENEKAIRDIRENFQDYLAKNLNLYRVTAPLFVLANSGINDGLNGIEKPVSFHIDGIKQDIEIVHSLAKWKRYNISRYGFKMYEGLYTNMNAIRKDERRDNYHSIYVDQWDYELIIKKEDRNLETLKNYVEKVYKSILEIEDFVYRKYKIEPYLPKKINFVTSQELLDLYPDENLSFDERLNMYIRNKKAVFVIGIGHLLSNNKPFDLRAPDYDDWNLNGDLFVYNELLDNALELSSMGIRVDRDSLYNQLKLANKLDDLNLDYQQKVYNEQLPYTLGGGIGQSRLCMFLLKKLHIGEVQSSIWDKSTREYFKSKGVELL